MGAQETIDQEMIEALLAKAADPTSQPQIQPSDSEASTLDQDMVEALLNGAATPPDDQSADSPNLSEPSDSETQETADQDMIEALLAQATASASPSGQSDASTLDQDLIESLLRQAGVADEQPSHGSNEPSVGAPAHSPANKPVAAPVEKTAFAEPGEPAEQSAIDQDAIEKLLRDAIGGAAAPAEEEPPPQEAAGGVEEAISQLFDEEPAPAARPAAPAAESIGASLVSKPPPEGRRPNVDLGAINRAKLLDLNAVDVAVNQLFGVAAEEQPAPIPAGKPTAYPQTAASAKPAEPALPQPSIANRAAKSLDRWFEKSRAWMPHGIEGFAPFIVPFLVVNGVLILLLSLLGYI